MCTANAQWGLRLRGLRWLVVRRRKRGRGGPSPRQRQRGLASPVRWQQHQRRPFRRRVLRAFLSGWNALRRIEDREELQNPGNIGGQTAFGALPTVCLSPKACGHTGSEPALCWEKGMKDAVLSPF